MRHKKTEIHRSPVVARLYDPEPPCTGRKRSGLVLASAGLLILCIGLLTVLSVSMIVFSVIQHWMQQ